MEAYTASSSISLSPRKGMPGEQIVIRAEDLPPSTPLLIKAGRPATGYQPLRRVTTSRAGTLQVRVRVPAWAEPGAALVFVVTHPDNNDVLLSPQFAVK